MSPLNKNAAPRVINGHVILTPATCHHDPGREGRCEVCDYRLAVCALCGTYEAGLDSACPGVPRPLDDDAGSKRQHLGVY